MVSLEPSWDMTRISTAYAELFGPCHSVHPNPKTHLEIRVNEPRTLEGPGNTIIQKVLQRQTLELSTGPFLAATTTVPASWTSDVGHGFLLTG